MGKIYRKKKTFRGRRTKRRYVTKTPNRRNYRKYTLRRKTQWRYPHRKFSSTKLLSYTGMTKNLLPNSRSIHVKVSLPLEYIYEQGTYGDYYSDHLLNIDQMIHPDLARFHAEAANYRFCRVRGLKIKFVPYPYPHDSVGNEVNEDVVIAPHVFYYGWHYSKVRFAQTNISHEDFNRMMTQKYYAWQYNNAKHTTKFYIPWPHKLFDPYLKAIGSDIRGQKRYDTQGWWNCKDEGRWVPLTEQAGGAPYFHYGFRHVLSNIAASGIQLHFGHLFLTHYLEFKGATAPGLMCPSPDPPEQPETDLDEEMVPEPEPPRSEKSVTKICKRMGCMAIKKS